LRAADEERVTRNVAQPCQQRGNGGLRHAQGVRGTADMPLPIDRDEGVEQSEVQLIQCDASFHGFPAVHRIIRKYDNENRLS
jgi:hypothetical protein